MTSVLLNVIPIRDTSFNTAFEEHPETRAICASSTLGMSSWVELQPTKRIRNEVILPHTFEGNIIWK
jgi:hypothetical protein